MYLHAQHLHRIEDVAQSLRRPEARRQHEYSKLDRSIVGFRQVPLANLLRKVRVEGSLRVLRQCHVSEHSDQATRELIAAVHLELKE